MVQGAFFCFDLQVQQHLSETDKQPPARHGSMGRFRLMCGAASWCSDWPRSSISIEDRVKLDRRKA